MILEKFRDLVGSECFYDAPEVIEKYSRDYSFVHPTKSIAVVKPKTTEKIKDIIDLANETKTSIIPTSSGFPKFHGDTIPLVPGIIIDLSNLDQVLRIDQKNRIAIIEPGVTFSKLRAALDTKGMVPYTPLLPRSTKSVLSSALEREPITIPKDHWDYNDPIASGEVIIGDGHIQGFGNSAGRTKQEVERGDVIPVISMGPSNIGWLTMIQGSQGTLGIVRWISVHCRMKPSLEKPFLIKVQELEDILPFTQEMLRLRFAEEFFVLNAFGLANLCYDDPKHIRRLQTTLPPWILFISLAGYNRYPEEELAWKEEQIREVAILHEVELKDTVGEVNAFRVLEILENTARIDRRLRYKASCQDLSFSTTLNKMPDLVTFLGKTVVNYGYPADDLSIYIQPTIQGCQCECEILFPYDPVDKGESAVVKDLFTDTARGLSNIGAYYSRPYGILAEITYRDPGVVNVLRKIKTILDPNNIMNSGKLCF